MVWGLLLALPLIVTEALAGPEEVGAKLTTTEHFPFGRIWPLQLVEAENSLDSETLPPLKVTVAPPAVLTRVTPFTMLLPTLTVPKFKELLETRTIADALGVGAAIGVGVGVGAAIGVGVEVGVASGVAVVVTLGMGVAKDNPMNWLSTLMVICCAAGLTNDGEGLNVLTCDSPKVQSMLPVENTQAPLLAW